MGDLYRRAAAYLPMANPAHSIIEIGTARGHGGSTHHFAALAHSRRQSFYTIDVESRTNIVSYINYPTHSVCMAGSTWTKDHLPKLDLRVDLLYLDNFDWDYSVEHHTDFILQQKFEYSCRGITMSNQASVREHLAQIIYALPYMAPGAVVICDDTYLYNDCWIGKCAAVVPYLEIHGYDIVQVENESGHSYGVILKAPS